ncbi:MAG: (Fe-S)-binding protein [Candidatus Hodarchaeales archaeon]
MTASENDSKITSELEEELRQALEKKLNKSMLCHIETCARSGTCNTACHMYQVTGDPKHSPMYKMELLRRFYRYYFTRLGRKLPWLTRAKRFSSQELEKIAEAAYECTGCRRCAVVCPLGIDPTWMISAARHLSSIAELAPEDLEMVADTQSMRSEAIEEYMGTYLRQIDKLEKKLQNEINMSSASITVAGDQKADILYLPIAGAHTIMPVAKIFEVAGLDWVLSKYDAANYAYFLGDLSRAKPITKLIIEEAKAVGAKTIVVTECGHAFRIMKHLTQYWFDDELPFKVESIVETLQELIVEGKIKVDPEKHPERLTYHDPCNLGRNGDVFDAPRQILNKSTQEFVELSPNRERNWCCGGGGGIVAVEDFEDLRMNTGLKKAEQIKATNAKTVVTACENCKAQLEELSEHYDLELIITGVMDIVAEALILENGNDSSGSPT